MTKTATKTVLEISFELETKFPKVWDSFRKSGGDGIKPFPLRDDFYNYPFSDYDRRIILYGYVSDWMRKINPEARWSLVDTRLGKAWFPEAPQEFFLIHCVSDPQKFEQAMVSVFSIIELNHFPQ